MDTSFYAAALGAMGQQNRLNITANNMSNVNTSAYKAKQGSFIQLIHYNMHAPEEETSLIQAGSGVKINQTYTNFSGEGYHKTGNTYDYAIEGSGFFKLSDPVTGEVTYTRDGRFQLSVPAEGAAAGEDGAQSLYLISSDGKRVLDQRGEPFMVKLDEIIQEGEVRDEAEDEDEADRQVIGIYDFPVQGRLMSVGDNQFQPMAGSGEPVLLTSSRSKLKEKALENSNVNLTQEMTKIIESQRAYSLSLRMLQTSDETENTINALR